MAYISNTDDDRRRMFEKIGVSSFEEIIDTIPEKLRLNRPLDIPALPELQLLAEIETISQKNRTGLTCFAGGGVYDHFIPAALTSVLGRPEFMTAYTPYQPEVAQGTLQVIYEFQSHICRLTGMDVANASMYDGASAAAEAAVISTNITRRHKVVISETVSPLYRQVVKTYLAGRDTSLVTIPHKAGLTDIERLVGEVDDTTAAVLVAQPNFFGLLEEIEPLSEVAMKVGAKLIMAVDPIAQALLRTPADYGADFVVGEGQPLGIPLSFGGPLVGFFAAKKELIRSLPGRIAARTVDVDGREGFVLTLQTREQHIRRDKATSNICTNQALCATAATIYMSLLGKTGLKKVALLSAEKAQQAAKQIFSIDGIEPYFDGSFVREFPVKLERPATDVILEMIDRHKIVPGVSAGRWYDGLDNCLLIATTEKRTNSDITGLVDGLKELVGRGILSGMQD
jgi:glycine dehydrogenase subunit 1